MIEPLRIDERGPREAPLHGVGAPSKNINPVINNLTTIAMPTLLSAAIIIADTPAKIRAYSIAVVPVFSFRNAEMQDMA